MLFYGLGEYKESVFLAKAPLADGFFLETVISQRRKSWPSKGGGLPPLSRAEFHLHNSTGGAGAAGSCGETWVRMEVGRALEEGIQSS